LVEDERGPAADLLAAAVARRGDDPAVALFVTLVQRVVVEWADAERRAAYSLYDEWLRPPWLPDWARPAADTSVTDSELSPAAEPDTGTADDVRRLTEQLAEARLWARTLHHFDAASRGWQQLGLDWRHPPAWMAEPPADPAPHGKTDGAF
jgi:hypothetical protein